MFSITALREELNVSISSADISEIENAVLKLHQFVCSNKQTELRDEVEKLIIEGEREYLRLYRICKPYVKRLREYIGCRDVRLTAGVLSEIERAGKVVMSSMRRDIILAEDFLKRASSAARASKSIFTTTDPNEIRTFLDKFGNVLTPLAVQELEDLIGVLERSLKSHVSSPKNMAQLSCGSRTVPRRSFVENEAVKLELGTKKSEKITSSTYLISLYLSESENIIAEERKSRLLLYKLEIFTGSELDVVASSRARDSLIKYHFLAKSLKQRVATQVVLHYDSVDSSLMSPIKSADSYFSNDDTDQSAVTLDERTISRTEVRQRQVIEESEAFDRVVELTPAAGRLTLLGRVRTMTERKVSRGVFLHELRSPSPE